MKDAGLTVLFGLPASRQRARKLMQPDLAALLAAEKITEIIEAGGDAVPEDEISRLLARASFGISAQDELSITKSGAFMAYAAHGLNILSPFADSNAAEPLCWATHPAELLAGLPEAELKSRAAKLQAWQERTCSWSGIAEEFARALKFETD